jgi:hypothetical protein
VEHGGRFFSDALIIIKLDLLDQASDALRGIRL